MIYQFEKKLECMIYVAAYEFTIRNITKVAKKKVHSTRKTVLRILACNRMPFHDG